MPDNTITRYFLGANSAQGFYSLYDNFALPMDGVYFWVIKGGPGCGKSSFMKRIGKYAEQAGLDVEYILCSGDPDSLDGVYIPALKTAYADGTAPHVLDSAFPGASGKYLDLSTFYSDELRGYFSEIESLNRRYKGIYNEAYSLLKAAGSVGVYPAPALFTPEVESSVRKRARGLISRELGHGTGKGKITRRFISAISCQGRVFLRDTVNALCERVCVLDNDLGFAAAYLDEVIQRARERGYDLIVCPDPLYPENTEAVLIPEASLGFVTATKYRGWDGGSYRHSRLDALADSTAVRRAKTGLKTADKLRRALVNEAIDKLTEAKKLHDELEAVYNPLVDFDGVYALVERHAKALGIAD